MYTCISFIVVNKRLSIYDISVIGMAFLVFVKWSKKLT